MRRGNAELIHGRRSQDLNKRLHQPWMAADGLDVVGRWLGQVEDVTIAVTPRRFADVRDRTHLETTAHTVDGVCGGPEMCAVPCTPGSPRDGQRRPATPAPP